MAEMAEASKMVNCKRNQGHVLLGQERCSICVACEFAASSNMMCPAGHCGNLGKIGQIGCCWWGEIERRDSDIDGNV